MARTCTYHAIAKLIYRKIEEFKARHNPANISNSVIGEIKVNDLVEMLETIGRGASCVTQLDMAEVTICDSAGCAYDIAIKIGSIPNANCCNADVVSVDLNDCFLQRYAPNSWLALFHLPTGTASQDPYIPLKNSWGSVDEVIWMPVTYSKAQCYSVQLTSEGLIVLKLPLFTIPLHIPNC